MKKILLVVFLAAVIAFPTPGVGNTFFTEQAEVLQKDHFLLREGAFFSKFIDLWEPVLYENDPSYSMKGTLSQKGIFEFPFEFNAGLSDNLTVGFSTSYLCNFQELNIKGNPEISDGLYNLSSCGFAYLGLSGKYALIKEEDDIPGFSILLKAKIPLSGEDLFAEDKDLKLKMPPGISGISLGIYELISKKIEYWAVHFNLGYEYCAPYTSKSDSLGNVLSQPCTIDPGDKLLYNFAFIRDWQNISLVIELNGSLTRDLRINSKSIKDSGMNLLDGCIGIYYNLLSNFSLDAGVKGTIFSSGRNQEKSFGPIIRLNQRF